MRSELGSPHPDSVILLTVCAVSGIAQLAGDTSEVMTSEFARAVTGIWVWSLTLGSITTVVGLLWQGRQVDGISIEFAGRCVLAPPSLLYGATVLLVSGSSGALAGCLTMGLGLACAVVARKLWQALKRAQSNLNTLSDDRDRENGAGGGMGEQT